MKQNINKILIVGFALSVIVWGLNKFLLFVPVPPPAGREAQAFLGQMFASYLAKLVGLTEICGGILLLFRRTSFIALLLLFPVLVNIVVFHFAHDFVGNAIWIPTAALFAYICYLHREDFIILSTLQNHE